jgi:hypothetical protein
MEIYTEEKVKRRREFDEQRGMLKILGVVT